MSVDSVSCASAAQQGAVDQKIAIAVLQQQQNAQRAEGAAVVQLIQAAATVAKAPGKGRQFDAVG